MHVFTKVCVFTNINPTNTKVLSKVRLVVLQYGKQTVPISAEEDNHLKYLPEKDMQVIGFVALDQVPRHTYMKVSCCTDKHLQNKAACKIHSCSAVG